MTGKHYYERAVAQLEEKTVLEFEMVNEMKNKIEEATRVYPYTTRRKLIYKGKMAPAGSIYLVVKGKVGKYTYEAPRLVKGGLPKDIEKEIFEYLWALIQEKANLIQK